MSSAAAVFWPLTALLGAVGLHALAPRRAPLIYLGPAACTVALIAIATLYVATIWSR
ncbi:hypothetical protein [Streptomyces sp. NPDC051016]|uniref:hypothetical protein n=1 Tax=Streptomyces sp. NPDC051016 TaxID=3365638 RepID=UPI00379C9DB6